MNKKIFFLVILIVNSAHILGMQHIIRTLDHQSVPVLAGILPVIIPGFYYKIKNHMYGGRGEKNIFRGYIGGVIAGATPGVNGYIAAEKVRGCIEEWVEDKSTEPLTAKQKAKLAGYGYGLSLWASIPLVLKYAKRVKPR